MKPRERELSEAERATIKAWCRTRSGSVRQRDRACIVAWSARAWWVSDIARVVGVTLGVVRQWIQSSRPSRLRPPPGTLTVAVGATNPAV